MRAVVQYLNGDYDEFLFGNGTGAQVLARLRSSGLDLARVWVLTDGEEWDAGSEPYWDVYRA